MGKRLNFLVGALLILLVAAAAVLFLWKLWDKFL
jgi:hypothetical protein